MSGSDPQARRNRIGLHLPFEPQRTEREPLTLHVFVCGPPIRSHVTSCYLQVICLMTGWPSRLTEGTYVTSQDFAVAGTGRANTMVVSV
jgi:hypothetical protein